MFFLFMNALMIVFANNFFILLLNIKLAIVIPRRYYSYKARKIKNTKVFVSLEN